MTTLINGIDIILWDEVQTGIDELNAPVVELVPVTISNVLVTPVSTSEITDSTRIYGKQAVYELSIPKGDTNIWENKKVTFFGEDWITIGYCREWIESNVPLDWNRKIQVARYG